ncbi:MAG: serine hydrolase domain-containing protein [Fimbriimonas sp.]
MITPLLRTSPERAGLPSSAVREFLAQADGLGIHSLLLLRGGSVIVEANWAPYSADVPHVLHSLSKSFTSTAVSFAIAEGLLTLDDTVVGFFPDRLPEVVSENLAAMRVRDLLTMSCGHADEPPRMFMQDDWPRAFLAHPVPHAAGTHFVYNSIATYMVAAILARVTGEELLGYLKPRLFDPIGIEGMSTSHCPEGVAHGGFGMRATVDAIARFGQLYLQDGVWDGERVLPEGWVQVATCAHVSNGTDPESDWAQGYGFQFWRCRHGAYRGDGAFGQYCVVHPELDFVLAVTSGIYDMGAILNAVWTHLLPHFGSANLTDSGGPVRYEGELPPKGTAEIPDGLLGSYVSQDRDFGQLSLSQSGSDLVVGLFDQPITAGASSWIDGVADVCGVGPLPVSARLVPGDGLEIQLLDLTSPMRIDLGLRLTEDGLVLRYHPQFTFGGEPKEIQFTRQA